MSTQVTLQHVRTARESRDPQAADLLLEVIQSSVDSTQPPPREGGYDFHNFLSEINDRQFFTQASEQQAQQRIEKLKLVEDNTELEPRYQSHQLIYELWQSGDAFDRRVLLDLIARSPLVYGPWKAFKKIFKEAEVAGDTEVMGALSARFDTAYASGAHRVSKRTLGYLCRRSWRYLRRISQTLPACYADTVVDFLIPYKNHDYLRSSWVYNQIFVYESKNKGRTRFHSGYHRPPEFLKTRAFADLWKRSPLPLFSLLQHSRRDDVLQYAVTALKTDFRTVIREIEPRWVVQLINHRNSIVHNFVIWILQNVSAFEQSRFGELGLHDSVLELLDSPSGPAREFAAKYARVNARDLPVEDLIRHANNNDQKVRSLANDLLRSRDPRTEIGLEAWGQLLDTKHGNKMAAEMLHKHFTSKDLTPEWFKDRLLGGRRLPNDFAQEHLWEVHSFKKLGAEYLLDIYNDAHPNHHHQTIHFVLQQLEKADLSDVPVASLEQILICNGWSVLSWVAQGLMNPNQFSPEFLKGISYHPTFAERPEVIAARDTKRADLAKYDEQIAVGIFGWLSDIRQFTPDQIGFQWLMELVQRDEPHYHEFAADLMIKSYLPADFAPEQQSDSPAESEGDDQEINIDFEQATFVFTGKLATMTRAEAQKKVAAANGKKAGTVGKNLGYLVIGDEGSPMYGMGRKGSKQVKAEALNEAGASIRIISETAFLQMLSGTQREFSDDAVQSGCETLWSMLLDNKEGTPLARFAIKYVRHHHPEICLAETDRPVDPGSEIPDSFLNFESVKPLLCNSRHSLRALGLELCQYEFARMAPPANELLELCQLPYSEVREFVAKSMTEEPTPQNRKWLLNLDDVSAEDVYAFCQSKNSESRALGMRLIEAHPRLREPEKLFALTESPDRNVRAFVIQAFWALYRERGVTGDWKPNEAPVSELKKKKSQPEELRFGTGAPTRPEQHPAAAERMKFLLRRMLFEVPPGRPPIDKGEAVESLKVKPLPTRKAKLLLIETLRDMAIKDHEFANVVLPVIEEFMQSVGMSEHAACLVAVTRIRKALGQTTDLVEAGGAS